MGRRLRRGDPLTGKKRQKTGPTASKAEARQLEARLSSQVGAGQHGAAAGKTVADLIETWFQWRLSVRPISPNTLVNYRRYADQKLLPALGRLPLNRVDTAIINRFYAELRQRGSKCQHRYRHMRDGLPPMRPGEVFRCASAARSASTRPISRCGCTHRRWPSRAP